MRLMESRKQTLTLRLRAGGTDVPAWGPGISLRTVVQPLTGSLAAQMYGLKVQTMRLMLYDGGIPLGIGMGVCLEVSGTDPCDYQIIDAQAWAGHQRATLEWIPPGRRA